jgi:hypothetical protein
MRSSGSCLADGKPKANASTVEAATDCLRLNPDHANPFHEVFRADRFVLAPEGKLAGEDVAFSKLGEREPVGLTRRPRKRLLVDGPGAQSPEILVTQAGGGWRVILGLIRAGSPSARPRRTQGVGAGQALPVQGDPA